MINLILNSTLTLNLDMYAALSHRKGNVRGIVAPVAAISEWLQAGVAVAHVHANPRAVAHLGQTRRGERVEPRRGTAEPQAVADVEQVPDRTVLQPVPVRDAQACISDQLSHSCRACV